MQFKSSPLSAMIVSPCERNILDSLTDKHNKQLQYNHKIRPTIYSIHTCRYMQVDLSCKASYSVVEVRQFQMYNRKPLTLYQCHLKGLLCYFSFHLFSTCAFSNYRCERLPSWKINWQLPGVGGCQVSPFSSVISSVHSGFWLQTVIKNINNSTNTSIFAFK